MYGFKLLAFKLCLHTRKPLEKTLHSAIGYPGRGTGGLNANVALSRDSAETAEKRSSFSLPNGTAFGLRSDAETELIRNVEVKL